MANGWTILIASLDGFAERAADVHGRLFAAWDFAQPVTFQTCPIADVNRAMLDSVDVVVLIGPSNPRTSTFSILSVIAEASVPLVAILDGTPGPGNPFTFCGALVHSIEADDIVLVSSIHGLLFREKEVRQLRREMALYERFRGGLEGELSRIQEELQLAAMVQREFLPRDLPIVHDVRFAAMWRPVNFVSGDIYDVIRLDEDHVGVFLADAAGHGVPAALMTMIICRSLITKEITGSTYRIIPPGEVLARLNESMIRRRGFSSRFATAVYGVVNCRNRTMTLAGAGHPASILVDGEGDSREIETTGGLLGVFENERYDEVDLELQVDDRLVLYSDGFEQAFPAAESDPYSRRLPTKRYRDAFERLAEISATEDITHFIAELLDGQMGSLHQIDDLTMVCVHARALTPVEPMLEAA